MQTGIMLAMHRDWKPPVFMHARMHACMQADVWAWQSKEVSTTCVPALCLLQHRMVGRVGVYGFAF